MSHGAQPYLFLDLKSGHQVVQPSQLDAPRESKPWDATLKQQDRDQKIGVDTTQSLQVPHVLAMTTMEPTALHLVAPSPTLRLSQ